MRAGASLLLILGISCSREALPQEEPTDGAGTLVPYTLTVSSGHTRTCIDGTDIRWETGDALAVYDGTGKSMRPFPMTEAGVQPDGSASFSGNLLSTATTLWVVYPQDAAAGLESGNLLTATLPSEQTLGDGNTASASLIAVGTGAKGTAISLNPVFSYIQLTVGRPDISSIVVRGSNLAGTAKFNASTGEMTSLLSGRDAVTFLPREGEEVFETGTYYIAVLPGTTASGALSVVFNRRFDEEGELSASSVLTSTADKTFVRGDSKAKLFAWNGQSAKWTAKDIVYLDTDIDMEGDSAVESTHWEPHLFKGTFDGQGHRLYNFVCKKNTHLSGFFSELNGATVRNLVLGSSDGLSWDGVSQVKHEYDGSETSEPNAGAVCGRMMNNASTISGVINFATVELGSDDSKKRCRLGGISGYTGVRSCRISACVNYGAVVNHCTSTTPNQPLGGIIGSPERDITLENCTNYGTVTSHCAGATFIGGIIGTTNGQAAVGSTSAYCSTLTDCKNYGVVSSTVGRVYMGGIAGALTGGNLDGCDNYGPVSALSGGDESNVGGIAGRHSSANASTIKDSSNQGEILASASTAANNVGGILGHAVSAAASVTLEGVVNRGGVHACGASSAQSAAGGIVGRFESAGSAIDVAENAGMVWVDGPVTGGQRNAGGICAVVTTDGTAIILDACSNSGAVFVDGTLTNTKVLVGGILGYAKKVQVSSGKGTTKNTGSVYATGCGSDDSATGGIVAYLTGDGSIIGTEKSPITNTGPVYMNGTHRRYAGGIAGLLNNPEAASVRYALNTGKISSVGAKHFGLGGICGGLASIATTDVTMEHCTNEGAVENIFNAVATDNHPLRWAGGILGRQVGSAGRIVVQDCVNGVSGNASKGKITLSVKSNRAKGEMAGGIAGGVNCCCTFSRNINYAPVSLTNAYAGACGWAGGILGGEDSTDNDPDGSMVLSENVNYGTVSVSVNGAARAGAGGIIGWAYSTASGKLTGNESRGGVSWNGTATLGGAGAVIGDARGTVTGVTATVSKSITVGGLGWAAAEAAGKLNDWLCPNLGSGTITPTYVE